MDDKTKREAYEVVYYDLIKCAEAPICPDRAYLKQAAKVIEEFLLFYWDQEENEQNKSN